MASVPTVASTDAVHVAVHDLGGDGPVILYSHATGLHGLLWAPLAHQLPGYRGLAVDYRGHGDATAPTSGSYDWAGFRDDAMAVVATLGDAGPLLGVGHSMGGAVLVMTELARPGTFRALALYEPIVFPPGRGDDVGSSPIVDGARRRRPEFPSREAARANFASKPPLDVLDPAALDLYVAEGFRETPEGTVRLKCEPATEALTFMGSIGHDIYGRLDEVRCPVLVMAAPPEEGTPAAFAEDVARSLPHGELHRFDHLGHFGPLEDPKAVAAVIGAFFTAQGA
jgi:pimeloyl-ACP methyl ester carboxylesterase